MIRENRKNYIEKVGKDISKTKKYRITTMNGKK
jgi:hypothetical protein